MAPKKKTAKKTGAQKPKKKPAPKLKLDRNQDTTSVLNGPMRSAIRDSFLKRPVHR